MSNRNQTYIAPEVEILEIEVEHGFAGSTEKLGDTLPDHLW